MGDRFGNRVNQNVIGGSGFSMQTTVDPATNRTTKVGAVNTAHDAAGNMTYDTYHNYTYNAENLATTVDGAVATYSYDAGNLRVKKVTGGVTTTYIFSGSKVIAEYTGATPILAREYIYSGSQLLATIDAGAAPKYHHLDHLSVRVTTDSSGNKIAAQGHFPFGEAWYQETGSTKWQFTSYERDGESGNDYAIFRNYSNRLGRFTMPDPLPGSIGDPQSLSRYGYVRNDPLNYIDRLGLFMSCPYGYVRDSRGLGIGCLDSNGGAGGGHSTPATEQDTLEPGGGGGGGSSEDLVKIGTNCLRIFAKIFGAGFTNRSFQDTLKATPILSSRDPLTANWRISQIVGPHEGSDPTLLQAVPSNSIAVTISGAWGSAVLTQPNFYSGGNLNDNLVHEGLHVFTGLDDATLKGLFKRYGLKVDPYSTKDINEWIARDCKKKK